MYTYIYTYTLVHHTYILYIRMQIHMSANVYSTCMCLVGYSCLNETESFSHDQAQDGTTDFVFMWPETAVGGVARLQCPCTSNPNLTARIFAVKKCIGSDTWSATDWASCQLSPSLHRLCTAVSSKFNMAGLYKHTA